MSAKKNAKIAETYRLIQKYPGQKSALLDRLLNAKTFTVTIDDFNAYHSLMVSQNIVEPPTIVDEYPDIPAFTQSDKYSDTKILEIFEARDSLQNVIDEIGSPPTDAEWFQAGQTAEKRIARLRGTEQSPGPYEVLKAEEWESLSGLQMPFMGNLGAMGPLQFLADLVAGPMDWRYEFKEDLHERGPFTSWNPLTGFGAWEIAEFQRNPKTGKMGFSDELIAMEDELEKLYGDRNLAIEKIDEGRYRETLPGSKTMTELDRLNTMITEEQLLDPRMFGEAQ